MDEHALGTGEFDRLPPGDDATELDHLLFRQDDVIARRQALRWLSAKALRHRLRSGRWQRPHRAVYVAATGRLSRAQRRWIAVLATDGLLAGLTALEVSGLKGYVRTPIHVVVPVLRNVRRPPTDVVVHRTSRLRAADGSPAAVPPRTMPARSLIDAAQWAGTDDEARAIIAAGYQQRLVAGDDLHRALARMRGVVREGLIRETADDASHGAESISELDFLRLCRRAELPEPTRQAVRYDAHGNKRYRDAFFEEYGLHVEIDGGQHMEVRAWTADMRQHNEIVISGVRLLRFTGWQLRHRPREVVDQLRAALIAGGWRP